MYRESKQGRNEVVDIGCVLEIWKLEIEHY